jgi:hypothetical protein
MDIIFLDIDGVLRTTRSDIWWSQNLKSPIPENLFERKFDQKCVSLLNQITNITKAKIVITSTWRTNFTFDQLKKEMLSRGIQAPIIGTTPILENRGTEIECWLDMNQVDNYVVIDDNISDMINLNQNKIVKCNSSSGITENEFNKIVDILCFSFLTFEW